MVDGCTKIGALFRILLPLSAPGLVASAVFSFTLTWNEFLLALVLTSDDTTTTVPMGATDGRRHPGVGPHHHPLLHRPALRRPGPAAGAVKG